MSAIKIEKNVPLPVHDTKYPLAELNIGDSFECDSSSIRAVASWHGTKYGKKFTVRIQPNGKTRVWRVS